MVFPYRPVLRPGSRRLLPLVPVTLHGPGQSIDLWGLVDSGAEQNVFHADLASDIGLSLENEPPVVIVGVAGQEAEGRLVPVEFEIGEHRWAAPAIFSPDVSRRPILGQAGFFAFFTVTFRYRERVMEIDEAAKGRS